MAIKKNPVLQALGIIIRRERLKRFWDIEDLEKRSGITSNYLRSIEQGSYAIHISKSYSFYLAFAPENEGTGKSFSLEGLMQIIALAGIMETNANDKTRDLEKDSKDRDDIYAASLKETAKTLAKENAKFQKLFSKFFEANLFDLYTSDDVLLVLESSGILKEVEDFILNYENYGLSISERNNLYLQSLYGNIPTRYASAVQEFAGTMCDLPNNFSSSDIDSWINGMKDKVQQAFVLASSEAVFDVHTYLMNHHVSFLWQTSFEFFKFFVVEDDARASKILEKLRVEYQEEFIRKYKNKNAQPFEAGIKKIQIKNITESQKVYNTLRNTCNAWPDFFIIYKLSFFKYVGFYKTQYGDYVCLTFGNIASGLNALNEVIK